MDTGYDGSQFNNISSNKNYNTRLEMSTVQIRNALPALQEVIDQQTETSRCHRKIKKSLKVSLLKSQQKNTVLLETNTDCTDTNQKTTDIRKVSLPINTHRSIEIEFYSHSSTDFCTHSQLSRCLKKLNKLFSIFLMLGIAHLLRSTPMSNS